MTPLRPLAPGATIGILGTGQLGRMLALAAAKLGFRTISYGPETDAPAIHVTDGHVAGRFEDPEALRRFAAMVDVATYEFENIPPLTVRTLIEAGTPVRPDENILGVCQDRLAEKKFLTDNGARVAPYHKVDSLSDLKGALSAIGGPAILKTRRFGYDGKGQVRMKSGDDPALAYEEIGDAPAILEELVDFSCEISQIAARGQDGDIAFFDIPENIHAAGILRQSRVPADIPRSVAEQARTVAAALMETLDFVGIMTIEFFWSDQSGLMVNEIAPRVHNSGHWTVECCTTSQFEQHVRAVAGWPLGDPARHVDAVMRNLIGPDVEAWEEISSSGMALTLYGKNEARPGRKMGHTVEIARKAPSSGGAAEPSGRRSLMERLFGAGG
ncbi:MAG: 5-(carboxyamino)imidazole ribonucleotide synthase [Parvularcula sp.]